MSASRPGRLGMLLGLTVAAAAATWWLAATQLALRQSMSTAALAAALPEVRGGRVHGGGAVTVLG